MSSLDEISTDQLGKYCGGEETFTPPAPPASGKIFKDDVNGFSSPLVYICFMICSHR